MNAAAGRPKSEAMSVHKLISELAERMRIVSTHSGDIAEHAARRANELLGSYVNVAVQHAVMQLRAAMHHDEEAKWCSRRWAVKDGPGAHRCTRPAGHDGPCQCGVDAELHETNGNNP